MAEKAYGVGLRRLAEFCLVIYPFGLTVCFQVIYPKFIIQILYDMAGWHALYSEREEEVYSLAGNLCRVAINVVGILINMVFILKREISVLQKLGIAGVGLVTLNVIIIVITSITGTRTATQVSPNSITTPPSATMASSTSGEPTSSGSKSTASRTCRWLRRAWPQSFSASSRTRCSFP